MKSSLPLNPMKVLKVSLFLRFILYIVKACADLFQFWKRPFKQAAACFEHMSVFDKLYWVYKSNNHIIHPEKGMEKNAFYYHPTFHQPGEKEVRSCISLSAVGDLIKINGIEKSKNKLYSQVSDLIFSTDISIANLESPISHTRMPSLEFSSGEAPAIFCSKAQYRVLTTHNHQKYTILNTATNHILDRGEEGIESTLRQLESDEIWNLGTGQNKVQLGVIIEKKGIKTGFISATFGVNGKKIPDMQKYTVNIASFHGKKKNLSIIEKQISYCHNQECDIIIASLHWGYEYEFYPREHQREIAHHIVETGVDVIISHHPHVLQPCELYKPVRALYKNAFITYSLGNITSNFSSPALVLSCIVNLSICKGTLNGNEGVFIDHIRCIPVVQVETIEKSGSVYHIETLNHLIASGNYKSDRDIKQMCEYSDMIFGTEWRY